MLRLRPGLGPEGQSPKSQTTQGQPATENLQQLRVSQAEAKVRLFRGGVAAAHLASPGTGPSPHKAASAALCHGGPCGRQKLGNLEVTLSSVNDKYQRPHSDDPADAGLVPTQNALG